MNIPLINSVVRMKDNFFLGGIDFTLIRYSVSATGEMVMCIIEAPDKKQYIVDIRSLKD